MAQCENFLPAFSHLFKKDQQSPILKIAANYRKIIRQIKRNPTQVTLHDDDQSVITIDGCRYDLDAIFTHNDVEVTEYRMAIDCLLSDLLAQVHRIDTIMNKAETELNRRRD